MSVYMLVYSGNDELDTTAFLAEDGGNEEAIAVFTSRSRASHFASEVGWGGAQPFREFTAIELLTAVVDAHKEGTQYLVVNPSCREHSTFEQRGVVMIDELLANFADKLTELVSEQATVTEASAGAMSRK